MDISNVGVESIKCEVVYSSFAILSWCANVDTHRMDWIYRTVSCVGGTARSSKRPFASLRAFRTTAESRSGRNIWT